MQAPALCPVPPLSELPKKETLEARALALVNPSSGIANDYLNLFNEIIMLIENYPVMPELIDDILAWKLVTYRQYFAHSSLPGRTIALEAYDRLQTKVRDGFEQVSQEISCLAQTVVHEIRQHDMSQEVPAELAERCAEASAAMMSCLHRATHIVNFGTLMQLDDPQERVERLLQRRATPGRRHSDPA